MFADKHGARSIKNNWFVKEAPKVILWENVIDLYTDLRVFMYLVFTGRYKTMYQYESDICWIPAVNDFFLKSRIFAYENCEEKQRI